MILENAKKEELETILEEEQVVAIAPKKKGKATPKKAKEPVVEPVTEAEPDFDSLIAEWKAAYKKIFKNEIDDEIIIWRRLKRGEYKQILNTTMEDEDNKIMNKQEMMVKAAVLYPFNIEELIDENAGLATVLSEEILAKSGFAISFTEEL